MELAGQAMAVDGEKLDYFRESLTPPAMNRRTDSKNKALLFLRRHLSFLQLRLDLPVEDFQAAKHLEGQSAEQVAFVEGLTPAVSL